MKSTPSSTLRDEPHAEVPDGLVLGLEHLDLGQAVLRDAVAEHAAGRRVALDDRDGVALDGQVVGSRHAGRAGADDGDALARGGLALEGQRRLGASGGLRLEDLVAGVAVAVADGDGLLDLVAAAVLLAGRRADAAEHRREGDGALEDARRLDEVALGVGLQEARDVDVAGALVLAGRQAVGVVVAEDELEVGLADLAQSRRLRAHDHLRLGLRASTRSVARPRPRPRRRTCGRPRSRAAWARSRGWEPRCRCRGRPPGWSGPRARSACDRRSRC